MGVKLEDAGGRNGRRGPNGLQDEINSRFRAEILKGKYRPGARLPSRAFLERKYRTTPATIQKAFDRMAEEGFVVPKGRSGTFVADHPPCLSDYAIVFPSNIWSGGPHLNFWRVLAHLAESGRYEPARRFRTYLNLNGHTDEPDYIRLYEDMRQRRLAGVILASPPHLIANTPLFKEMAAMKDLPKAMFTGVFLHDIPAVSSDPRGILQKIMGNFQSKGGRRLAVVSTLSGEWGGEKIQYEDQLFEEAKRHGLQLLPQHVQVMHTLIAPRARQLVHLLLDRPPETRPDCLLILDDSLVEAACKGVEDSGVKVPEELSIAAYCNFPEPPKVAAPVTFYGLDVEKVLKKFIEVLDCQRHGKAYPEVSWIPLDFVEAGR